ncbi:MAG: hypothetical protein ACOC53_05495 [Candidatus Saliniplasma sp.]
MKDRVRPFKRNLAIFKLLLVLSLVSSVVINTAFITSFSDGASSGMKSLSEANEYFYTDKEVYDIGEPVTLVIKNNGDFSHVPLAACLEVNEIDTSETVFKESCTNLPMVPAQNRTEVLVLEQSVDIPEKEGDYRAYLPNRENYTVDFSIRDLSDIETDNYWIWIMIGGCISIVIITAVTVRVKKGPKDYS